MLGHGKGLNYDSEAKRDGCTLYNGVNQLYNNPYGPQIIRRPLKKAETSETNNAEQKVQSENPSLSKAGDEQSSSKSPNRKSSIDYNSTVITVNQILVDFKNTLGAIGVTPEIEKEVNGYLDLVHIQALKPKPTVNIIKSNLLNASNVLDTFITDSLGKPSDVVSNWVKALFLQNINWKAEQTTKVEPTITTPVTKYEPHSYEELIEEAPSVEPPIQLSATKTEITTRKADLGQPTKPVVPELTASNTELLKVYQQLESLVDSGEFEKAMPGYDKALQVARNIGDLKTEAKIYMDLAYMHDMNNNIPLSLEYYNSAALTGKALGDNEIQSKAHYNMGTLYDDVGKVDLALQHYFAALGLDGQTENIQGQSLTLNNIGNMFAVKGDYKKSLNYYKVAYSLVSQLDDNVGKSSVLSNVAGVFRDLGYNKKALENYSKAVKFDVMAGNISGYAKSYEQSGDIMMQSGQKDKAAKLYKKSLNAAVQISDKFWAGRMMEKLAMVEK